MSDELPPGDVSFGPKADLQGPKQPAERTTKIPQKPGSLLALIGAGKPDFESIEEVDAFIRAERAAWGS